MIYRYLPHGSPIPKGWTLISKFSPLSSSGACGFDREKGEEAGMTISPLSPRFESTLVFLFPKTGIL